MEPLEVFPELVWKNIFEKIEDDKDKLSFLRAHSAFRKQFEKEHVELGFLFALPVLMDYFQRERAEITWKVIRERRQSILSCRLVSRKCSKAVDNWMESHWEKTIHPPLILLHNKTTQLWTRPQLQKFTTHFGTLPDNRMPILSRSLELGIPLSEEARREGNMNLEQELEDNQRRIEILTVIGNHVKELVLNISFSDNPGVDNVENMRERIETFKSVLEQVPNLKSLYSSWEPICNPDWEEDEGVLDFPDLPHLVHLSFQVQNEEDYLFATDLAPFEKYFPQLTHLSLFGLNGWKDEYLEVGRFPKLLHLQLVNIPLDKKNHKRKLLRMCRKLFAPNLQTFSVHVINYTEKEMEKKATRWIRKLLKLLDKAFKDENCHWHGCQVPGQGRRLHFLRV